MSSYFPVGHQTPAVDRLVARLGDVGLSRRRISLPVLKTGTAFSDTATRSPVFGLRPVRAPRFFTANVPKPRSSTRSPCASASPIVPRIAFTIFSMSRKYRCGFCSASLWTSSDLIMCGVGLCSDVIFSECCQSHIRWSRNGYLIFAPKTVLKDAVVHELCRLRHRTHDRAFWGWSGYPACFPSALPASHRSASSSVSE
jgi:hypothetical protein